MAKQSPVSPANSVLLQALKMIWHTSKNRKRFELYFDATSYSEDTDNSIAHKLADMTQSVGAILSSVSSSDIDSMLKVFLFITELLMSSILITFFILQCWEPLNIYYSVRAHAAMTLCASTSHYRVQLSVPIFRSRLSTWRLPMYLTIGAQSFDARCRIYH